EKTKINIFKESSEKILRFCENWGYAKERIQTYKIPKFLCENFKEDKSAQIGNFLFVNSKIPFHLTTHIVRHRGLTTQDNLIDLMKNKDFIYSDMHFNLNVSAFGTIETFEEITSKRSCW